ncbi:MAG: alpha/beta fold hydrolase [Cytophagales bacterium]|nr:MAG: alpha/beta fold hydrolase [Cytophagales bacterium]
MLLPLGSVWPDPTSVVRSLLSFFSFLAVFLGISLTLRAQVNVSEVKRNIVIYTEPIYTTKICKGESLTLNFGHEGFSSIKRTGRNCSESICESTPMSPVIAGPDIVSRVTKTVFPPQASGFLCPDDQASYQTYFVVQPTKTSTYTVTYTEVRDYVPCTNAITTYYHSGTITITVVDPPKPSLTLSKTVLKPNESYDLIANCTNADPGYIVIYSAKNNPCSTQAAPFFEEPYLSCQNTGLFVAPAIYKARYYLNGCYSEYSSPVKVDPEADKLSLDVHTGSYTAPTNRTLLKNQPVTTNCTSASLNLLDPVRIAADGSTATFFTFKDASTRSLRLVLKNSATTTTSGMLFMPTASSLVYAYTHPVVLKSDKPEENYVDFQVTENYKVIYEFRVFLTPPPLLLLHGLGGNGTETWGKFRNHLIDNSGGRYSAPLIRTPDLRKCDYFEAAYPQVATEIDNLIRAVVASKISAWKVDIAGHSMGGILARYHLNRRGNGQVNRLITCNTPHWGSQWANWAYYEWMQALPPGCSFDQKGAIADLKVGSAAINAMALSQTAVLNTVPTHVIFTIFPPRFAACNDAEIMTYGGDGFNYMDPLINCNIDWNIMRSEGNDLIVSVRSQRGGMDGAFCTGILNQWHIGSVGNAEVMNRLTFLLKQSPQSGLFTTSGFAAPYADYQTNSVTQSARIAAPTLKFDPALSEKAVKAGETHLIKLTKSSDVGSVVFLSNTVDSDSITLGFTNATSPQFSYKIRPDFQKRIRLLAIAKVGGIYVVDSTFLNVVDIVNCTELVSIRNGDWNDPRTWSCNRVPQAGDAVRLRHAVTIPNTVLANMNFVRYDVGGRLVFGGTRSRLRFVK